MRGKEEEYIRAPAHSGGVVNEFPYLIGRYGYGRCSIECERRDMVTRDDDRSKKSELQELFASQDRYLQSHCRILSPGLRSEWMQTVKVNIVVREVESPDL